MYLSWLSLQYLSLFHLASMTNPPDAYFYSDTHDLVWDKRFNCWTKDGTSHLSPSPSPSLSPDHHSTPTLHSYSSATSVLDVEGSISTLRMATPEPFQYHGGGGNPITTGSGGGGHARPLSQMSFSDDLQTIPSQEVLFTCTLQCHIIIGCMKITWHCIYLDMFTFLAALYGKGSLCM